MPLFPLAFSNIHALIAALTIIATLAKMQVVFGANLVNADNKQTLLLALLNIRAILIAKVTLIAFLATPWPDVDGVILPVPVLMLIRALASFLTLAPM